MKVYNVEIFSPLFVYRSSMQVSNIEIEIDYIATAKNKIELPRIDVLEGDYIRINYDIVSIVSGVKDEKTRTIVSYKSFADIFDVDVKVDVSFLSTGTIEGFISKIITDNYITNADSLQNIYGLSTSILTGTTGTSLDLPKTIVNFYKDVVKPAFLQYNVLIGFAIDVQDKQIICAIGKNTVTTKTIETRLPNILSKNIDVGISTDFYNKMIAVNSSNEAEQLVYYLHPDNTINTTNSNRIEPVKFITVYIEPASGKTFATLSLEKAIATLKKNQYNNLIEIEISNDDELIKPATYGIGQVTNVIDGDKIYNTVLTGKRIGKTTTLIFGAVRKDLTKKLKWGL